MARRRTDPVGPIAALALLALGMVTAACRSDIVVRVATRIFEDGSVSRRIEVVGRRSDDKEPSSADWLEKEAGIHLARPDAWARRDSGVGRLSAEGSFQSVADVPPSLAFETDAGLAPDSTRPRLAVEDLLVLRRWVYAETYSDPFGPSAVSSALDHLTEMTARALREEIRRQFGERLDPSPAERFVRTEARALAAELLEARSRLHGGRRTSERVAAWSAILARHGIAVVPGEEGTFWDAQLPGLLDWSRLRVADALSRPDAPVAPADLSFWPTEERSDDRVREIAEHVWGSEEAAIDEATPSLRALTGYYGSGGSPRYRFEPSLVIPGKVLATNGTQGPDGISWLLRDEDLGTEGRTLEAESVTLDDEKLKSLGARRDLEPAQLLQLTDILARRDPDGELRRALAKAVEKGRLSALRANDAVPEDLMPIARELADLLDPAVPRNGPP